MQVDEFSMLCAKRKQKNMKKKIALIENELEKLENSHLNSILYDKLKTLFHTTLHYLYDKQIKKAQLRYKAN